MPRLQKYLASIIYLETTGPVWCTVAGRTIVAARSIAEVRATAGSVAPRGDIKELTSVGVWEGAVDRGAVSGECVDRSDERR